MTARRLVTALLFTCAWWFSGCAPLIIYDLIQVRQETKKARETGTLPPAELIQQCQSEATVRQADGAWGHSQAAQQTCLARNGWVLVKEPGISLFSTVPTYKRVKAAD